jgi:hypothetical protein
MRHSARIKIPYLGDPIGIVLMSTTVVAEIKAAL